MYIYMCIYIYIYIHICCVSPPRQDANFLRVIAPRANILCIVPGLTDDPRRESRMKCSLDNGCGPVACNCESDLYREKAGLEPADSQRDKKWKIPTAVFQTKTLLNPG